MTNVEFCRFHARVTIVIAILVYKRL